MRVLLVLAAVLLLTACAETQEGTTPTPEPTPVVTPEPSPEPVLLGGEDRRACGYFFASYEWAVVRRENRFEDKLWFTNEMEVDGELITLKNGCRLREYGTKLFHGDEHELFTAMQFRTDEFGRGKLRLFHQGVLALDALKGE